MAKSQSTITMKNRYDPQQLISFLNEYMKDKTKYQKSKIKHAVFNWAKEGEIENKIIITLKDK
jgi:hypothetical protein